MKKIMVHVYRKAHRLFWYSIGMILSHPVYASALPTPPSSEQLNSSTDFLDIAFNLFKDKVGPLLVYGVAIFLIVKAIWEVIQGVNAARRTDNWGELKSSVTAAAVMVTIGLALAYAGYNIFNTMEEGS